MDNRLARIKEMYTELSIDNIILKEKLAQAKSKIVYCKDCKNSNINKMGWYCNKHCHGITDADTNFCSWGERNDNNG